MNKFVKSLWQIVSGLLILATAAIIAFVEPEIATLLVLIILSCAVFIYALKQLWLYFTMARYMIGGLRILFEGLIALDFAIYLMSLNSIRGMYIMIYLIVIYFASGAIDLFRAFEIKKLNDKAWIGKAAFGLFHVVIAVLCLVFIQSDDVLRDIYAFGLVVSAIRRIAQAFQKTNMVYIQ